MTRLAPLLLLPLAGCVLAPPPPVCAQPEVLALLAERLEEAGRFRAIEAGSVNQRPSARSGLVECTVRVETATYDTSRFGAAPVVTVGIVQYSVELRKNGVFLLPLGSPPAAKGSAL